MADNKQNKANQHVVVFVKKRKRLRSEGGCECDGHTLIKERASKKDTTIKVKGDTSETGQFIDKITTFLILSFLLFLLLLKFLIKILFTIELPAS